MSGWWVALEDLKPEQQVILDLDRDQNHLLEGPPGSGKTNLLLLRANYMHLDGRQNLGVVVFQKALKRFIAIGGNQYDFPLSKLKTSVGWQHQLLKSHGIPVPPFGSMSFDDQRKHLNEKIWTELIDKGKVAKAYDTLFIDEAHDYTPDEIKVFVAFSDNVFFSADAKQRVYSVEDGMPAVLDVVGSNVHTLKFHFRMGAKICSLADQLGKAIPKYEPLSPTCNYAEADNPSDCDVFGSLSLDAQIDLMLKKLGPQREAFPNELLGVIVPMRSTVERIYQRLKQTEHAAVVAMNMGDENDMVPADVRVCVTTIHGSKGLEFRAAHFVSADELNGSGFKLVPNLIFTAVTRAKTTLYIYHNSPLPGGFAAALTACGYGPKRGKVTLKDVFGKKKGI